MKSRFKFLTGLKVIVGITFFILLCGYGTMLLWNWLVPVLFKGPTIVFWQAIGLLVLSRILFGGWGRCGGSRTRHCGGRGHWKARFEERLKNMTPEERERVRNKCGSYWMPDDSEIETKKPG